MEVTVVNIQGEEVGSVELPASVFDAKINRGLMHQALVRQMANARRGTHSAKSRSEVRYTNAKIYRQKGTGRARHGSRRAPIFVGGGVAHGPKQRDYTKKMPRKMRRAALKSALSVKAQSGDIVVIDEMQMDIPKTKRMAEAQQRLAGGGSALLLLAERDENVEKSARNLPTMKALRAMYLNIRDLLGHDKIVIPLNALEQIAGWLGNEDDAEMADYNGEQADDSIEEEA